MQELLTSTLFAHFGLYEEIASIFHSESIKQALSAHCLGLWKVSTLSLIIHSQSHGDSHLKSLFYSTKLNN